ncbi:MAG: TPM domain-containing protein [Oligoflexia bacterium]|nr:TPM domain-containing protein [Oligoflexia bacterium]
MKHFSLSEIEKAIAEAEYLNKGEILPVIVKSSASYSYASFVYAFLFLILGTALWLAYEYMFWGDFYLGSLIATQALSSFVGALLGLWEKAVRMLYSQKMMAAEVHESALASFTEYNLGHTKEKTGILIYISMFEKRVEIVADEGIYKKVGKDFWLEEVENIVKGIRQGNHNQALIEEIQKIGKKLREHFPQMEKNVNEISNSPKVLS